MGVEITFIVLFVGQYDNMDMPTKPTINYCHKNGSGLFTHFYVNANTLRVCYNKTDAEIYEVRITEDESGSYYSYWDVKDQAFKFTSHHPGGVSICFPYDMKEYEERGKGKICQVRIDVIKEGIG